MNFMDLELKPHVFQRVFEHAEYVDHHSVSLENGHKRLFTALQGSQNYGLDDEFSDVDTKSLMLPSFRDLVFNKNRLSTTIEVFPTIEHADVKDVREMFSMFRKQNINFLEILFTPYVDVAEGYQSFYEELYTMREEIAHWNLYQGVSAMSGHMAEKYHAFDHPYPASMEKIEKFGYDPKQLHHQIRFKDFLYRFFIKGESYESCLKPNDPEWLKAVKRGSIPLEEARELKEELQKWNLEFRDTMRLRLPNEWDKCTSAKMDELLYEAFKTAYKEGVV